MIEYISMQQNQATRAQQKLFSLSANNNKNASTPYSSSVIYGWAATEESRLATLGGQQARHVRQIVHVDSVMKALHVLFGEDTAAVTEFQRLQALPDGGRQDILESATGVLVGVQTLLVGQRASSTML